MTSCNGPESAPAAPPSALESDLLRLVWQHGPCTADQARELLSPQHPLKDSTIRTLLRRLTAKGLLECSTSGRAYLYSARVEPGAAAAQAVRRIIDRFYSGSVEQLLVGLVASEVVDDRELKSIAAKISAAKRSRK